MATARDIVYDALRLATVTDGDTAPTAAELTDGITDLNDLLAAWSIDGLDLGEDTLVAGDTVQFADAYLLGVKYNLAVILCEGYGVPVPPAIFAMAEAQRRNIRNDLTAFDDLEFDTELIDGWSARRNYT